MNPRIVVVVALVATVNLALGALAHRALVPRVNITRALWDCTMFGIAYQQALLNKCIEQGAELVGPNGVYKCIESHYGNGEDARDVSIWGPDGEIKDHAEEYVAWCFNDGSVGGPQ